MVTPHDLKDMDILTVIPEYDEDGQFSSLVIVDEYERRVRISPMINLSTEIPYLEVKEEER